MLKSQIFHVNSVDKFPKMREMLEEFLSKLGEDALVSVNTTEVGPAGTYNFYSYTVLVIYKEASG
ncbi:MAG: hypothetical protein ACYC2Y_09080 [Armatimonadota bacterium]